MADPWPLYVNMTVGIFNTWLGLILGFQLLNDSIRSRDALITGVLASLVNHGIRQLGVIFGVHTLATVITIIFLCVFITNKDFWKTATATAIAFAAISTTEATGYSIAQRIVPDCYAFISAHPYINIITVMPINLLIIALIYASRKYSFFLFNSSYFEIESS